MLHLRRAGLLQHPGQDRHPGKPSDSCLDWWESKAHAGTALRKNLMPHRDGIDPDDVIMAPDRASAPPDSPPPSVSLTAIWPRRVRWSRATPIDPSRSSTPDGVFPSSCRPGPGLRTSEEAAIHAIKNGEIRENDVVVLICGGPAGAGMEEIYQITSALKWLPRGQARGPADRCPFQRCLHRGLHRAYFSRGVGRRPDRQGARGRSDRDPHRSAMKLTGSR